MQVGGHATSGLDVKGVGESLRERYQVPDKLTPKLLKLVSKLDAIEADQSRDYEQWLEARTVAAKAFRASNSGSLTTLLVTRARDNLRKTRYIF